MEKLHSKDICDNMAVVQVMESSKLKDDFLAVCIKNIWLLAATFDIDLLISHNQGKTNIIADALSRINSEKDIASNLYQSLKDTYVWDHMRCSSLSLTFIYNFSR